MLRWLFLLGGPLIWAIHFVASYAIASIAEQVNDDTGPLARALIVIAGVGAIGAALVLIVAARRLNVRAPIDRFTGFIAQAGAIFAIIAVIWQSLPALAPI